MKHTIENFKHVDMVIVLISIEYGNDMKGVACCIKGPPILLLILYYTKVRQEILKQKKREAKK